MNDLLFACSGLMGFFALLWFVRYPMEAWESITFRNDDGFMGHVVSVGTLAYSVAGLYFSYRLFGLVISL